MLTGYWDMVKINRICSTLQKGANLGCRGQGRLQTIQKNSPTAYKYGVRLVDSLQGWLEDDLACGPLSREEIEKVRQGLKTFGWRTDPSLPPGFLTRC